MEQMRRFKHKVRHIKAGDIYRYQSFLGFMDLSREGI